MATGPMTMRYSMLNGTDQRARGLAKIILGLSLIGLAGLLRAIQRRRTVRTAA